MAINADKGDTNEQNFGGRGFLNILTACLSSNLPTTNWGVDLKVPLDTVEEVENGSILWGN